MARLSVRALRNGYRASVGLLLLSVGWFILCCVDGPSDALSCISAGCAVTAAAFNAWNFRTNLRRRLSEEQDTTT